MRLLKEEAKIFHMFRVEKVDFSLCATRCMSNFACLSSSLVSNGVSKYEAGEFLGCFFEKKKRGADRKRN